MVPGAKTALQVISLPGTVLASVAALPALAGDIRRIADTTESLPEIERQMAAVAECTSVLPELHREIAAVAAATATLPAVQAELATVDGRMATIEATMPALVQVERSLVGLPETMGELEAGIGKLLIALDSLFGMLRQVGASVDQLHGSVQPLQETADRVGRLIQRLPGGRH